MTDITQQNHKVTDSNNEYADLLTQIEELKKKLQPEPPVLTDVDHLKAHVRLAFEEIYSNFFNLEYLVEPFLNGKLSEINSEEMDKIKKYVAEGKKFFEDLMNEEALEPWEKIISPKYFSYIQSSLDSIHSGDCTAFPCTCERCLSETYYKLPYTANWGKHEGYKMFNSYSQLNKQKEIIEQAKKLEEQLPTKQKETSKNKI